MGKLVRRRRSTGTTLGAVLGTLALCLRLAWPGPAAPLMPDPGLAAALGVHALCLAAAPADDRAPFPRGQKWPSPGDPADHDGLGCCLWHVVAGFTLPRFVGIVPIAFIERPLPRLGLVASALPSRTIGSVQARAPPEAV
jgi:hypothetical protein